MTIGVGGSTPAKELADLDDMTMGITPVALPEYEARIHKAQRLMREKDIAGIYVNAGTSLYYFTGTRWGASERMVGAIIPASGQLEYIAPAFEEATLVEYMTITGRVNCWEEDESPYALMGSALARMGLKEGTIGIDEAAPFFISDGLHSYQDIPVLLGIREETGPAASQADAFLENPHHLRGRELYYSGAIGSAPEFAEVIIEQARRFGA